MGCPCGSSGSTVNIAPAHTYRPPEVVINCDLNQSVLKTWMGALQCIKTQDKFVQAGIALVTTNQILGILQSGLNYPENYCYFFPQLEFFKDNLLPKIVINVPECFS
jgi:hypothetical protein